MSKILKFIKFSLSSQINIRQILKFHEKPNFSSQFLRVNGILKGFIEFVNLFYSKGDNGGLNFALYARNNAADKKSVTYPSFLNPSSAYSYNMKLK